GDRYELVALLETDEAHALSRAAHRADVLHRDALHDAALGDHDQVVVVRHREHADDLAVAVRGLDVDDALAAARLQAVLLHLGALAEAVLAARQDRHARRQDDHVDDPVALLEVDAVDADRRAAHGAHVAVLEPD